MEKLGPQKWKWPVQNHTDSEAKAGLELKALNIQEGWAPPLVTKAKGNAEKYFHQEPYLF